MGGSSRCCHTAPFAYSGAGGPCSAQHGRVLPPSPSADGFQSHFPPRFHPVSHPAGFRGAPRAVPGEPRAVPGAAAAPAAARLSPGFPW